MRALYSVILFHLYTTLCSAGNFPISFKPSAAEVEVYDFIEFSLTLKKTIVQNPFAEVDIKAYFLPKPGDTLKAEGFCDSQDGKLFKVRYMPLQAGVYTYKIIFTTKGKSDSFKGKFIVKPSHRKGPVRVDREHPFHMVWDGAGEHYFWNSTTTYWMMGWKDEQIIKSCIDRLAGFDINRIRVAINGRQDDGKRWYEPLVKESKEFTFKLSPWIAGKPDDLDNPEFDVTLFNVAHWQKLDRLVDYARSKNIIVSLIFYVDGLDHGCDPFKKEKMGNDDEKRYYRYAAARYSGFSNIMWDITNEYHLFRSEEWVNKMGLFLKSLDPAKHIISVHGNSDFAFRDAPWVDVVLYQSWDECGGYEFITSCREKQKKSKKILPQINEEYGYEDHYPPWGCGYPVYKEPDSRSADNRAKLAWEMYMAGGYQTTGERANEGTGAGNDAGGGWINGRGNNSMEMLNRYKIIKNIFEKTRYWEMEPHQELINFGNMCLANPGVEYLVYGRVPNCRLIVPNGSYSVKMFDPFTGEETVLPEYKSEIGSWQYLQSLKSDKVFIIKKI